MAWSWLAGGPGRNREDVRTGSKWPLATSALVIAAVTVLTRSRSRSRLDALDRVGSVRLVTAPER